MKFGVTNMAANPSFLGGGATGSQLSSKWQTSRKTMLQAAHSRYQETRASHPTDDINKISEKPSLYALKRKIKDAVARAEILAPIALEHEEARRIKKEERIHECNLWDDSSRSNEILLQLADSVEVVGTLKDLRCKVEETKIIAELAGTYPINYRLFKRAYTASVHFSKSLDLYEMSKLLRGSYDKQGASLTIKAIDDDVNSEIWVEQLLSMYVKWAEKQGQGGVRITEKYSSSNDGIKSATVEFEFKYAYGCLVGERGVHHIISSHPKPSAAAVDVIPLFLNMSPDMDLPEKDVIITSDSSCKNACGRVEHVIRAEHIPTGLFVHSSGERSHTGNRIKALNRLNAKLLIVMLEQGAPSVVNIRTSEIMDLWKQDTRRYIFHPRKLVEDLRTGVELSNMSSVLDGNIEPLIEAHINARQGLRL
ncbi:hypothetical protein Drorol1_Dr00015379 [Drosera rotundifolia]